MAEAKVHEIRGSKQRDNKVFLNSFRHKNSSCNKPYKNKLTVIACLKNPGQDAVAGFICHFYFQTREKGNCSTESGGNMIFNDK